MAFDIHFSNDQNSMYILKNSNPLHTFLKGIPLGLTDNWAYNWKRFFFINFEYFFCNDIPKDNDDALL